MSELRRAVAHGTFNGAMRLAQSRKFEHVFLSGFVSSLGGSYLNANGFNMSGAEKIAISAAIGGTAEALGGGKFANGAVTGAYVMALNHMVHPKTKRDGEELNNGQPKKAQSPNQENNSVAKEAPEAVAVSIQIIAATGSEILSQAATTFSNLATESQFFELGVDYTKEIGKVSKYGKITKWAGWVGTSVAIADVEIQYSQGKIDQFQRWTEHTSSAIGAIPVIGTAWTVGWYMGKRYGISTWF